MQRNNTTVRTHPIMHVNQEARNIGLKGFRKIFEAWLGGKYIWFNVEQDVVFFPHNDVTVEFFDFQDSARERAELELIREIAMPFEKGCERGATIRTGKCTNMENIHVAMQQGFRFANGSELVSLVEDMYDGYMSKREKLMISRGIVSPRTAKIKMWEQWDYDMWLFWGRGGKESVETGELSDWIDWA